MVTSGVLSRAIAIVAAAAPLLVAAGALGVFRDTLLPGVAFWDTAESQTVPPLLGTMHPTGFPSYVIIGFLGNLALTPFGEPAFRMNLLSAVFVAGAAGLTVVLVRRLTGSVILGVAAGVGFAATPIAWDISTHADTHALHIGLVALLLVLLVEWAARRRDPATERRADRWLVAAAAVYGVAAANHSLSLLLAVPIGVYVLAVERGILGRPRFVAACALAVFGTFALLYLELPLRAGVFRAPIVYGHPETLEGFLYVLLAEQFRGSLDLPLADFAPKMRTLVGLTVDQLGPLAALLPFALAATIVRAPHYALLSGLAVLVTTAFSLSYTNAEIHRYYLGPALIAWSWLAILVAVVVGGVARTIQIRVTDDVGEAASDQVAGEAGPAPAAATASAEPAHRDELAEFEEPDPEFEEPDAGPDPFVGLAMTVVLATLLILPTSMELDGRALAVDRSGDTLATLWTDEALAVMEPNAVLVSWWSYSTPLWYAQHIEGRRLDLRVVDDRTRLDEGLGEVNDVIEANLGRTAVYVIRLEEDLPEVSARFVLEPTTAFELYRVVGRVEGPE